MPKVAVAKSDSDFTARIQNLFAAIFGYHFSRKPIFSERRTPFGNYVSMKFRRTARSPLALLLKERLIGEPTVVEILVKNRLNQKIDDTDLESVILDVRQEKNALFVLATDDEVPPDDFDRLFRVFSRHLVIILPIGKDEIVRLEKFVKSGNINACLVMLYLLADRITTDPWDEKMLQRHGGAYAVRAEWQQKATSARLDAIAKLEGPQLRTLIKKLCFLMNFERSGNEISSACKTIKVSRKTLYLWLEKDAVFRKLLYPKMDEA